MSSSPRRSWWRRRALIVLLVTLGLLIILWFSATSPEPLVTARPAPTAVEVGAARDAYRQLRDARGNPAGVPVLLTPAHLDGIGALVSHGFRPDRFRLVATANEFRMEGSHQLPFGRWLNVAVRSEAPSKVFPVTRLTIGSIAIGPRPTRWLLAAARQFLSWHKHLIIPPLDRIVRDFSVTNGRIGAIVSLPGDGLINEMSGAAGGSVDGIAVVRIVCALRAEQAKTPSSLFIDQIHRAFSFDQAGLAPADYNRAAFVALGIFLVDPRAADLAHVPAAALGRCSGPPIETTIHRRNDWPKHWTLSAAIDVTSNTQLSEAVGEWKELADSLAKQSQFAVGDPSGFSMADLGADRAGLRAARAASDPARAAQVGRFLAQASEEQLLPVNVVNREDGMPNAEFVKRYGGLDDPRFAARVRQIDAELDRTGIH